MQYFLKFGCCNFINEKTLKNERNNYQRQAKIP